MLSVQISGLGVKAFFFFFGGGGGLADFRVLGFRVWGV